MLNVSGRLFMLVGESVEFGLGFFKRKTGESIGPPFVVAGRSLVGLPLNLGLSARDLVADDSRALRDDTQTANLVVDRLGIGLGADEDGPEANPLVEDEVVAVLPVFGEGFHFSPTKSFF